MSTQYHQFCPIAKASEVISEKWTMLIIRELLMGATRFNILQRGLGSISPTVLNKRLAELEKHGLVLKKKINGQKGYEYFITECGKELMPIIKEMGVWGMRWARDGMPDDDLDVELLMLYLQRSINLEQLPPSELVIRFHFTDLSQHKFWWLVVKNNVVDTCVVDPGKEIDIYFRSDLRTLVKAWMGDSTYRREIDSGNLEVSGPPALTKRISSWLNGSIFYGVKPANEISASRMKN